MTIFFDKWKDEYNETINGFIDGIQENLETINKKQSSVFDKIQDCIFLDDNDLSKRKYIETSFIEKKSIKETLEIIEVTQAHKLEDFDFMNVEAWHFVPPHVDNDDGLEDSTGYDEYQYAAFLFLQTDKHVIQTGFPKRMNNWSEDNLPLHSEEITPGDVIILDIQKSHALAFSDNKHLFDINMPKEKFIEQITPVLNRKAIAITLNFEYFPSREEVMEKFEERIIEVMPPTLKM